MKNEYGSFLPLDLRQGEEMYSGGNVIRLNTARSGIYYILKLLKINRILMPRYLCPSVRDFLRARGVEISCYGINRRLLPESAVTAGKDTALLLVNYFGLLPDEALAPYAAGCPYVIVDHSQAFYKRPFKNAYTVYSPRKFFGVPDGCYVAGEKVNRQDFTLEKDLSFHTSLHLLERLETTCSASYPDRMKNERRLDESGMLGMSALTETLLKNIDYPSVKEKRTANFRKACEIFNPFNALDMRQFPLYEPDTVPMAYPLVVEDEEIGGFLIRNGVYSGRLWKCLVGETGPESTEAWLSRFMLPLPIDQRIRAEDLETIGSMILNYCKTHSISQ